MNYTECLSYLDSLGSELRGVKFDLANMQRMVEALGDPERKVPAVLIAGTNGKGSTSAMLASILSSSGYRTGLYTSPHLVRVNERIRVDAREISDEDFALAFSEVERAVAVLLSHGSLPQTPSFFEFLTATAFLHFARAGVNFAVLEVGMGGRLDATNVAEPEVSVITNVELDHTAYLGGTHAAIAAEKAGVMRPGKPVISGCANFEAAAVVSERAAAVGAELIEIPAFARVASVESDHGRYAFDLALDGARFPRLRSPLSGRFQVENATAAVTAAWKLSERGWNIPQAAFHQGLARTRWPGRLETCASRPLTLLDGAHNPAAARALAEFVRSEFPLRRGRRVALVYASMRDKAIEEITALLFPLASEIYLTRAPQARAAGPGEILARAGSVAASPTARIHSEPDPARALAAARSSVSPDGLVLAAGSLYLVGALKQALADGRAKKGQ